jgi:glycerol-3-phosphate O-acyltransferase
LAGRVYPYIVKEYFMRWPVSALPEVVDELLEDLLNHGLLTASEDRRIWRRPPTESTEAVQLSVLARASVPILERYYLAISQLLRAGSGKLSQEALVHQCQLTAQRMSMLYALNSPEFFDRHLFDHFLRLLRQQDVLQTTPEGKLAYDAEQLEAIASDAKMVLAEQIRNSILQVVHR